MVTREEYAAVIREALEVKNNTPLSQAALEVLAVLSDTFQQDLQHSAQFAHGLYYNELEKLCTKHGYTQEVAL